MSTRRMLALSQEKGKIMKYDLWMIQVTALALLAAGCLMNVLQM